MCVSVVMCNSNNVIMWCGVVCGVMCGGEYEFISELCGISEFGWFDKS